MKRQELGFTKFLTGSYTTKGCFSKRDTAYFGMGGAAEQTSESPLSGLKERIWCDAENPTSSPTNPNSLDESCFTVSTYDSIDNDIANIKSNIDNGKTRSHFLGGIVQLAAHDFMDFDNDAISRMGPDGCFDEDHIINAGLSNFIWCQTCELRMLYEENYSHLSRADFWVASANAVIRQTSVNNALDLKDSFLWGRKDVDSCEGSGDRMPTAAGCDETEEVFLMRMGLEWRDAVALMGGHTLGRGTGHSGTWVGTDEEAQVSLQKKQEWSIEFLHGF